MKNLGETYKAYKYLLGIMMENNKFMVAMVIVLAVISGICTPLIAWSTQNIIDYGIEIANGTMPFEVIIPILAIFLIVSILPTLINLYVYSYVEPESQLILRTSFRAKILQKLKRLKYEHFENQESFEIIDKAINNTENSARHMFPMYVFLSLSSFVAVIGCLILIMQAKWWLLITILLPFFIELAVSSDLNYSIYDELDKHWKKIHRYGLLGDFLSKRDAVKENKLQQSSDFLATEYLNRQHERNREYESFFLRHLKARLTKGNLARISTIFNCLLLLILYLNGEISLGVLSALSLMLFNTIYFCLVASTVIIRFSGYHIKSFNYYHKFFELSEDPTGDTTEIPVDSSIEFKNVWFKYPGTDKYILKGLNCKFENGENISIVGENGEGKTTMIKLLLGLFEPNEGEILIGGCNITEIQRAGQIHKIFGTVFQDFSKYDISVYDNISVGNIDDKDNKQGIIDSLNKVGLYDFINDMDKGLDTTLGRFFDDGVDLSGGQWQRIAMARALFGDKKILILDEPTSQLDPIAESELYGEFAKLSKGKTSIFITHRLGSTAITDRIFVISDGIVVQSGTHEQLSNEDGIYKTMYDSQKHWYVKKAEVCI